MKQLGAGEANAFAAARDEGNFSGEAEVHHVLLCLSLPTLID
jgi:hypothetical protein